MRGARGGARAMPSRPPAARSLRGRPFAAATDESERRGERRCLRSGVRSGSELWGLGEEAGSLNGEEESDRLREGGRRRGSGA
jgi:hypothetical protein